MLHLSHFLRDYRCPPPPWTWLMLKNWRNIFSKKKRKSFFEFGNLKNDGTGGFFGPFGIFQAKNLTKMVCGREVFTWEEIQMITRDEDGGGGDTKCISNVRICTMDLWPLEELLHTPHSRVGQKFEINWTKKSRWMKTEGPVILRSLT